MSISVRERPSREARVKSDEGDAIELLRELVAGQHRIIALLEGQRRPVSALTREDRALLAKLLPAIGGAYGSQKFSSRDLTEDDRPAVRLVLRGLSVKAISKLFGRAAGIPIDGLMVLQHDFEFKVRTWQIVAC